MTETTFTISNGDRVWVPVNEDNECYKNARVKEKTSDSVVVFDDNYKQWTVSLDSVFPVNPKNFDGVPDNTQMMWLHDPSLLHNIRHRYDKNEIYTYTAYILIAVNPYKTIPGLYDEEAIMKYHKASIGSLPPHCYGIASRAYRMMKSSGRNQSIVVSGESGAGKTETCRYLMRFFALVAGASKGESAPGVSNLQQIETKILDSNPILEAFGNAKTLRNKNSSRFGKFTKISFNRAAEISGASIVTYILEKSRVVDPAKNERNFHVFYQLIRGASDEEKKKYKLDSAERYQYLNKSGCTTIEGVDDGKDFAILKKCMASVGIDDSSEIFSTLAGILHLGNVEFIESVNSDKEDVTIVSPTSAESMAAAAELLGFDRETLAERLVNRTIIVGNKANLEDVVKDKKRASVRIEVKDNNTNVYKIPLTVQESIYARDSLAKSIYSALFDHIVMRINKSLPLEGAHTFIGILDISGFEIFPVNSFEQFCINFANEKIQQYFNQQILQQEQEIYLLEGLQWRKIDYEDNQDVINLVEAKRTGLFALLDEECIMPKGTDRSWTAKIHSIHSSNNYLEAPKYTKESKGKRLNKDEGFNVKHFAGQVVYTSENFLDKNNDSLHNDLQQLLYISKRRFISSLFPVIEEDQKGFQINRRFKSVSSRFGSQLEQLMNVLSTTTSHFIRCIKPNELQQADLFNSSSVMQQLRYNGMCTALKLMQYGFPTRVGFEDLYERYASLMPPVIAQLNPMTFCEALLVALDLHGGKDFQMGLTKVFFRAGKLQFLDELTSSSQDTLSSIAGKVKKWLARKRWRQSIAALKTIAIANERILYIRKIHKLRKLARQMTVIGNVWVPLINTARQNILSSEEYKKRVEEEEKRREEERHIEKKRREEEERVRKEKEEEQVRIQEQLKKELEDAKIREEDHRRAAEDKLVSTTQKLAQLEEEIHVEQQKNVTLVSNVEQLKGELERVKIDVVKLETTKETLETKLTHEVEVKKQVEKKLHETVELLEEKKKDVEQIQTQLEAQVGANETLQHALHQEKEAHKNELTTILAAENTNKSELQQELEKILGDKSQLESTLREEQLAKQQITDERENLKKQLDHLQHNFNKHVEDSKSAIQAENVRYEQLEAQRLQEIQQKDSVIASEIEEKKKLREELSTTQNHLVLEKNTVTSLTRNKATLENQVFEQQNQLSSFQTDLHSQKEINNLLQKEIESLKSLNESLSQSLTQERQANDKLAAEIETEKKGREDDNANNKIRMEKLFNQAKLDLKAKQVVIKKLEGTNAELTTKLQEETDKSKETINDLETQLKALTKKHNTTEESYNALKAKYDALLEKYKNLEGEHTKLNQTALNLQETKRKFKAILERNPKVEDVAKLIFGDLSFHHIIRDCTKHGLLVKQGGAHVNRWQARHVVINENFLFYYASPSDKIPKGLSRIDGDYLLDASRCDLKSLKKENAFTVVVKEKDKSRAFFFSAATEEECNEWIKVIQQAQQLTTYI